jgi:hypothetical protein
MAADHALDQPLMREMIEAAILAVALSRGIDQRQIARLALRIRRVAFAGEIKLLQRQRDFLREPDADKAAGGDGVAIANQAYGFCRRDDLALLRAAQIGQCRMLAHCVSPEIVSNRMPDFPVFGGCSTSTAWRCRRLDRSGDGVDTDHEERVTRLHTSYRENVLARLPVGQPARRRLGSGSIAAAADRAPGRLPH